MQSALQVRAGVILRKLPPFGRPLYELQSEGCHPNNSINLFIGTYAWQKGHAFSKMYPLRTLILPPWLSPDGYLWSVSECDILIMDTGYADLQYLNELVTELYSANASIVRSIDFINSLVVHDKEKYV